MTRHKLLVVLVVLLGSISAIGDRSCHVDVVSLYCMVQEPN